MTEKVTITSERGQLSAEDVERMVKEAEEHAEEDKQFADCAEARNRLESYLYSTRSTVTGALKEKLSEAESEALSKVVSDALSWLNLHSSLSVESKSIFESKQREVEAVVSPIISKAYQKQNVPDDSGDKGAGISDSGPTVEEVR